MQAGSKILDAHAAVHNVFNLGCHLVSVGHYRDPRTGALDDWAAAVDMPVFEFPEIESSALVITTPYIGA
jgi:hypothetical protein